MASSTTSSPAAPPPPLVLRAGRRVGVRLVGGRLWSTTSRAPRTRRCCPRARPCRGPRPAAPEPDDALDAEVVAQPRLDLVARQRRVAVLVEQALLRGDQRPLAVHGDRAALEHEVGGVARSSPSASTARMARAAAPCIPGHELPPQALKPNWIPGPVPVAVGDEVGPESRGRRAGSRARPTPRPRTAGRPPSAPLNAAIAFATFGIGRRWPRRSAPATSTRAPASTIVRSVGAHSAGIRMLNAT